MPRHARADFPGAISFWLLLLIPGLTGPSILAEPLVFYVATNGNNNWSGRLAAPAANGQDGPLATLPAAVQAARLARREPARVADGITLFLRDGIYELT